MAIYRDLFPRQAGVEHVSRYVSGLLLSENKTLQGIHSQCVESEERPLSGRRAMYAGVFESPWQWEEVMRRHRQQVSQQYEPKDRMVISLDWTLGHHERGQQMYGVKRQYDYVDNCMSSYHTILTAVVANRVRQDGVSVTVQAAKWEAEELEYLTMSRQDEYESIAAVMERLSELVAYQCNRDAYQTLTELLIAMIQQIEAEGQFPTAAYAFDAGVCAAELTTVIEGFDKHWMSELACNRSVLWHNQWTRIDDVAQQLRSISAQSFRHYRIRQHNGEIKEIWAFSKVVRLKKIGRKRIIIVHEREDLSDAPRFLVTDALRWDVSRIVITWSYRGPCEIFHEFRSHLWPGIGSSAQRGCGQTPRLFKLPGAVVPPECSCGWGNI